MYIKKIIITAYLTANNINFSEMMTSQSFKLSDYIIQFYIEICDLSTID